MKSVCIVTPAYLSSTPRAVKEADALHGAGFQVRVVFSQGNLEVMRRLDEDLLKEKPWRWDAVGWSPAVPAERAVYLKSKLRFHLARKLPLRLASLGHLAECGEGRVYPELARLAAREPADIFIGHYPEGLAAAAAGAERWNSQLRYDMEDLHTGEQPLEEPEDLQTRRIRMIEGRYLPRCSRITASSTLVAEESAKRYAIPEPLAIYNVFPWADRDKLDGQCKDRKSAGLSLYWFSQTIGEGRGLEDAIRAVGLLEPKPQLHLRGTLTEDVRRKFMDLAKLCGAADSLHFHPPVPPGELLSRAAEHDVGLALEQPVSLNRMLSVTNKLFLHFLAGLAIAATDVPGQRHVMSTCPEAGFLYPPGDYRSLAGQLQPWLTHPEALREARERSLAAARDQWNWELASQKLVDSFPVVKSLGNS